MMSFTVILLISSIKLVNSQLDKFDRSRMSWTAETNSSLITNIRGKCSWRLERGFIFSDDPDSLLVSIYQPIEKEFKSFNSMPNTLIKANKAVSSLSKASGYTQEWSRETKLQWLLPSDHVAQNRSNCYKLTQLATKEGVLDLFQNFKEVHKTFYLLRSRNAVIHPTGSVMMDCGYYQGQWL